MSHVRVLQYGLAAAEVGHDAEVEVLVDRAFEDRPDATEVEGGVAGVTVVVGGKKRPSAWT